MQPVLTLDSYNKFWKKEESSDSRKTERINQWIRKINYDLTYTGMVDYGFYVDSSKWLVELLEKAYKDAGWEVSVKEYSIALEEDNRISISISVPSEIKHVD